MNPRRAFREELDLTQTVAALTAGVSLATWRRWEEDPTSVSSATREKCEQVLDRKRAFRTRDAELDDRFQRSWHDCPYLTPRQASAIATTLELWEDIEIREWLEGGWSEEPLHRIPPFSRFDPRVMIYVNENKAWAEKARERCRVVAEQIAHGILPFDREGCLFDELLIAAALPAAEELLAEMPEMFENIPPRLVAVDEESPILDDDWELVSGGFDDQCRWDEWEVPLSTDHPLLAAVLEERHPYTWFDPAPGTGAGYLRRLVDTATEGNDAT